MQWRQISKQAVKIPRVRHTCGRCSLLAAANITLPLARKLPFKDPKMERVTNTGIIHAKLGNIFEAKVTATAFDDNNSAGVKTVKESLRG